ncbi:hypothetical protein OQA88_12432 [Cercophora sp. LCS_1]
MDSPASSSSSLLWSASVLGRQLLLLGGLISDQAHYLPTPKGLGKELGNREAPPPRDITQNWCRIKSNEYGQLQCRGCDEICSLLRWGEVQRRKDVAFQGSSQPRTFHSNFRELNFCASKSGCDTCRMIRRAFFLTQITGFGAQSLEDSDQQRPISAVLNLDPSGDSLSLTIQAPNNNTPPVTATVPLSRDKPPVSFDPTREGARLQPDFSELRKVVQDCHENHDCSWKYRWSDRNPSWLLEILGDGQIRVVKSPDSPVQYVVLSYSWGDPAAMPAAEWARIKAAATKSKNGIPVIERRQPFSRFELPETMQDAIAITDSVGFKYIWIDSVCIPKGTNWDDEASVMHEVYGNAAFTLAASSCTKATDSMLLDRQAWKHRNKACKLRGMWLQNDEPSLDAVRLCSPVSHRGWTLQEERLSPRIVYWAGQRWYWSCQERQVAELSDLGRTPCRNSQQTWSLPQDFLQVCQTGDTQRLDEEWLDVVEAYTRRDLAHAKDRFLAISGLAARFYNSKVESGEHFATEEYLAGLWRDNFARHLAWSVDKAVDPEHNLQNIAPSWSWASLPLKVNTNTKRSFTQAEHFRFIRVAGQVPALDESKNRAQAVEDRGRMVKVVEVEGRMRRFVVDGAQKVSWKQIERRNGERVGFNFSVHPGSSLFARHPADGRVVSKEAHRGEIVGQLDYLPSYGGDEKEFSGAGLPEGAEKDLICLELGDSAMLLLYRIPGLDDAYRRVGICTGYGNRKGFFYGCESRRILLC